jgi:hypothetical protein
MSDSNDTSTIDDKRGTTNDKKKTTQPYWQALLVGIVTILIYYLFGGLAVYIGKISASNLLSKYIDEKSSNIHIKPVPIFDGAPKGLQPNINFKGIENAVPGILEFLRAREKMYEPTKNTELLSRIFLFFINIFKPIIELNYKLISYFFTYINNTLYEIITMLFGPFLLFIMFFILLISTWLCGTFKWLFGIPTLFPPNFSLIEFNSDKWLDNVVSFMVACTLLITLCVGGLICFLPVALFNCFITNFLLYSFMFYEGNIDSNNIINNIDKKVDLNNGTSVTVNYITFFLLLCGLIKVNLKVLFPLLSMFLLSITFGQEMKNPMLIWSVVVIALIVNISLWFGTFQNIEAKTTGGGGGVEMQNMSKGGGKKQISNMFEDYNFNIAKELKKLHKTI